MFDKAELIKQYNDTVASTNSDYEKAHGLQHIVAMLVSQEKNTGQKENALVEYEKGMVAFEKNEAVTAKGFFVNAFSYVSI